MGALPRMLRGGAEVPLRGPERKTGSWRGRDVGVRSRSQSDPTGSGKGDTGLPRTTHEKQDGRNRSKGPSRGERVAPRGAPRAGAPGQRAPGPRAWLAGWCCRHGEGPGWRRTHLPAPSCSPGTTGLAESGEGDVPGQRPHLSLSSPEPSCSRGRWGQGSGLR